MSETKFEGEVSPNANARPSSWVVASNESIVIGGVELWPDVRSGRLTFDGFELKVIGARNGKRLVNIYAPPGRVVSIDRVEPADGRFKQLVVRMRGESRGGGRDETLDQGATAVVRLPELVDPREVATGAV